MAWLKCPQCSEVVEVPDGQDPVCTRCGHGAPAQPQAQSGSTDQWGQPAANPTPVYNQYGVQTKPPVGQGMAIAALLLNILVWPGLGSLIAGEQVGWGQGFLNLGGVILTLTLVGAIVGIPMSIGAWVWGLITGIDLIQRADKQQTSTYT